METLHAAVFPLYGEGATVSCVVQGYDDLLEIDIATPNGTEIPIAAGIRKISMATKNSDRAIAVAPPNILHVDVINTVSELANEANVINTLVTQMTWIVIETESLVTIYGLDSTGC